MYNSDYVNIETAVPVTPKRPVSGVGGSNSPARLVSVLQRLGLCPSGLAASLETLAAHGGAAWQSTSL